MMAVPGFETSQLRFCSMHTINLGVLMILNGGVLALLSHHRGSVLPPFGLGLRVLQQQPNDG